jgi:signal transduction histidine kinase
MAAALLAALLVVMSGIDLPSKDLRLLLLVMSGTGVTTVLLAYLLYQQGIVRRFSSLRWALLTSIVITVLLVLSNVWITAQLMFISQHDFVLTTALLTFAGLTALIFGLFVASAITTRIRDLSVAAESLAEGKLETRLAVRGNDELSEFARTFNWMAESLQQIDHQKRMVEQTRRDLIAGVSHDLRTPLTAIRAMLEAINDEVVTDPASIARYVGLSLAEVENLSRLIDDLFELARLDAGHLDAHFEYASLRDLISDTISTMNAQASRKRIILRCDISQDIDPVYMVPDKIRRVLHNLLDNALRYTPPSGDVTIRAYRLEDRVCVDVHNTGAWIESVHLPHIFESFYRVERSRLQAEDGHRSTGLGLAIARGFIEAHRGKIRVESTPERGTTFSFAIPRTGHP